MGKADNVEKVLYTRSESNSPDKLEHNIATDNIRYKNSFFMYYINKIFCTELIVVNIIARNIFLKPKVVTI